MAVYKCEMQNCKSANSTMYVHSKTQKYFAADQFDWSHHRPTTRNHRRPYQSEVG